MMNFRFPKQRNHTGVTTKDFDETIVGSNLKTEYVPTYSVFIRQEILNVDKGYMYFKPKNDSTYYAYSNYDALFDALTKGSKVGLYNFTTDGRDYSIVIFHHYIADRQGNILMMMGMKNYVLNKGENPDDYKLFMSTEFMTNPIYKNIYKQMEKKYLNEVQESEIDIEHTTSDKIQEKFYNGLPKISYSSIQDLNNLKKKYYEYFDWISTLDEGVYYAGLDYQPPALIKPGYKVENLKVDDDAFQAVLWQFIKDGVSYPRFAIHVSFEAFIDLAENANSAEPIKFMCDHIEGFGSAYLYFPKVHEIRDIKTDKSFHLRLTSRNMVKKLSENLEETLWKVQNYVNFVQQRVSDDDNIIEHSRVIESPDSYRYSIPESMIIDENTPPEAIG